MRLYIAEVEIFLNSVIPGSRSLGVLYTREFVVSGSRGLGVLYFVMRQKLAAGDYYHFTYLYLYPIHSSSALVTKLVFD
jgi:hypothetical protein